MQTIARRERGAKLGLAGKFDFIGDCKTMREYMRLSEEGLIQHPLDDLCGTLALDKPVSFVSPTLTHHAHARVREAHRHKRQTRQRAKSARF